LFDAFSSGEPVSTSLENALERRIMPESDVREELTTQAVEPLLPIEKKLIGWSLGLGLALLVVLIALNHFVPVTL
jgi:hypothetical protein